MVCSILSIEFHYTESHSAKFVIFIVMLSVVARGQDGGWQMDLLLLAKPSLVDGSSVSQN